MVKISQKCAYIFLLAFGFLTVSFCQASLNDHPEHPQYPWSPQDMDRYKKQVAQWSKKQQQQNLPGTNFNNSGIVTNNITGNVNLNQGNTFTNINYGPKKDKTSKQNNVNNSNLNYQNSHPSNQPQQSYQQQNQYQPMPQQRKSNIRIGNINGSKLEDFGNSPDNNDGSDVDLVIGDISNSAMSNFGNIGRQPQQNQQQQPPVVHSAAPTEPTQVQTKERDKAIECYKKIIDDVKSNIGYNDKPLVIQGLLSDTLLVDKLDHITIIQRDGITFIQYFDEDKNNAIKNAIGYGIFFSWLLNNQITLNNALCLIVNKNINTSEILKTVNSFKILSNNLSLKEYVNKIKDNKISYYKNKQSGYSFDAYEAAWHANNIVVLHNFEITSECDYVELRARLKKLHTNTSDSFVLIIEQENGDPFQVLVNKYDNAIEILTTQKITNDFKNFMVNLFGQDSKTNKFLENRIMALERKNHKNQDCFAAVAKAIGIDKEFIDAFLKAPIVNKENKGLVQNSTKSNNEIIKPGINQWLNQQQVPVAVTSQQIAPQQNTEITLLQAGVVPKIENWKWVLFNAAWTFAKDNPGKAAAITITGLVGTYFFLSRLSALLFSTSASKTIVREVFDGYTRTTTYSDGSSSMSNNYSNNRIWH